MDFYDYMPTIEHVRKKNGKEWLSQFSSVLDFYGFQLRHGIENAATIKARSGQLKWERHIERLATEHQYFIHNCPYYMIHPQIVESFSTAKMDNIPLKHFLIPATGAFVIRLAKPPFNTFVVSRTGRVVRSILVGVTQMTLPKEMIASDILGGMFLAVDTGEEGVVLDLKVPITNWDETVETALVGGTNDPSIEEEYYPEWGIRCIRLALSLGFLLQSNNELVEPHVLSKDLTKYYEATEESEKKTIANRAFKRRGRVGYKVAFPREHQFPILPPPLQGGSSGTGERQLTAAHLRSGHWHLVRYGKNHSQAKVMWFFPTVVRPDLPFDQGT